MLLNEKSKCLSVEHPEIYCRECVRISKMILLVTPPFTQLNTPYPATAYLKGVLDQQEVESTQCDLSIELFTQLFTQEFIERVFIETENDVHSLSEISLQDVWLQKDEYISKVDFVLDYLRQPEVTAAYQILSSGFMPVAHRATKSNEDLCSAFGNLGVLDKAKYLATLFVEELGDFIRENVDSFFAFTKYAEQITSSSSSFSQIDEFLQYEPTIIEEQMLLLLQGKIEKYRPTLVCFTIPFPGNLFSALRCAQFIRTYYPSIKIAFGGGYCNTELLSLTDPTVFDYVDYICTADGEGPILKIIKHANREIKSTDLERTYTRQKGKVVYHNSISDVAYHHKNLPAPSYAGLLSNRYLSFLDVMNPMHRLWSDGRWNKLTLAHGCYWKQCAFCDVSLDYIKNYQIASAEHIVENIQKIIAETGTTGFHFTDEAAPPQVLKAMAKLLIEKKVYITWWTNIRFEKTFDYDFCNLLAKSGCIAVTGGLEVASDRLLAKMNKGVDIAQVARVTKAFSDNGVMTHAYLMYGFPTETSQETVDSLEIVRQLFEYKCIQSAFWHKFTTTIHSAVGKNPESFCIKITGPKFLGFAQNDMFHKDPQGANHNDFTKGLNTALQSYLNGVDLDKPMQHWFDFKIEPPTHSKDYIASAFE
jgi:hypothetical protein